MFGPFCKYPFLNCACENNNIIWIKLREFWSHSLFYEHPKYLATIAFLLAFSYIVVQRELLLFNSFFWSCSKNHTYWYKINLILENTKKEYYTSLYYYIKKLVDGGGRYIKKYIIWLITEANQKVFF